MPIRRLESADCAFVRARAEKLAVTLYPELIPDADRMHALLGRARQDSGWYAGVIGPKGAPTAALIAQMGDNVWASRRHATVMLMYSDFSNGDGARLLRDFCRWVREQKSIVLAGLIDDYNMPDRTKRLFELTGFQIRGGAIVFFPRSKKCPS